MNRSILVVMVLALVTLGAEAIWAGGDRCGSHTASPQSAACVAHGGTMTGRFDSAVSGMCRFSCATQAKYEAKDVLAQPGARAGKLTQCPVSGVVFAVDAKRPHVRVAGHDYVTCCDLCARKLQRNARRYLRV